MAGENGTAKEGSRLDRLADERENEESKNNYDWDPGWLGEEWFGFEQPPWMLCLQPVSVTLQQELSFGD